MSKKCPSCGEYAVVDDECEECGWTADEEEEEDEDDDEIGDFTGPDLRFASQSQTHVAAERAKLAV